LISRKLTIAECHKLCPMSLPAVVVSRLFSALGKTLKLYPLAEGKAHLYRERKASKENTQFF